MKQAGSMVTDGDKVKTYINERGRKVTVCPPRHAWGSGFSQKISGGDKK